MKAKLGVYLTKEATATLADFEAFNALIAPRRVDYLTRFTWFSTTAPSLTSFAESAKSLGAKLLLQVHPRKEVDGLSNAGTLGEVTTGVIDKQLMHFAQRMKQLHGTVIVRLCSEFNGKWNGNYGYTHETPEEFIAGWRYVVNFMRTAGVTNVKWCWNPNVWVAPETFEVNPTPWYPGDAYVDYTGLDGYVRLTDGFRTPEQLFLPSYETLVALAPTKPLIICEHAVAEDPERYDKAEWLADLFELIETKMPLLHALGYWNDDANKAEWGYLSIDSGGSNAEALAAFSEGVNSEPFKVQVAAVSQ